MSIVKHPLFRRVRTLLAGRALPRCRVCGFRRARIRDHGHSYLVWQCEGCGVVFCTDLSGHFTASWPPLDACFAHITHTGKPYIESAEEFIQEYQPLLARLEEWMPPGRLLDLGCGPGFFLEAARRRGWEVVGVDPSPYAVEYAAHTFGIPVQACVLADAVLEPASFDAVSLLHSLEHFTDPVATLTMVARALRPGGLLLITTPNVASEGYRLYGSSWVFLNPAEHVYLFDPLTLTRALEAAGLQVLEIVAPHREPPPHRDLLIAWGQLPKRVPMTRVEVVLRIGRALQLATAPTTDPALYLDLPRGEGEREIGALSQLGALPWKGPHFEPNRLVTRAEVGIILAGALGIVPSPDHSHVISSPSPLVLTDVPGPTQTSEGHPAWRYLHLLHQAGVSGFEGELFRPDELIDETELDILVRNAIRWRNAQASGVRPVIPVPLSPRSNTTPRPR